MKQYLQRKASHNLRQTSRYLTYISLGIGIGLCPFGVVQAQTSAPTGGEPGANVQPNQGPGPADAGANDIAPSNKPDASDVTATQPAASPAGNQVTVAPAQPLGSNQGKEPVSAPSSVSTSSSADSIGFGVGGNGDAVGFSEAPIGESETQAAPATSNLALKTSLRTQEALWTERLDSQALAKARQILDMDLRYRTGIKGLLPDPIDIRLVGGAHLEYDLAYLIDKKSYDQATIDTYRSQIIGRDTYISATYQIVEVTFGRQTLNWGQGMVFSPLDILSAKDNREPYLVDLEDQRMPVLLTRVQLSLGEHRLESVFVHESYFGLRPPPMGTFSPIRPLLVSDAQIEKILADKSLRYRDIPGRFVNRAGQFLERWSFTGYGFDLSAYVGTVLENQGVMTTPALSDFLKDRVDFDLWHPRYTTFGHTGSRPIKDVLLKWELGFDLNRAINVINKDRSLLSQGIENYSRINALLGANYTGITDTVIIAEYQQSYLFDNPGRKKNSDIQSVFPAEQPQIMLRAEHKMLQERLTVNAMVILMGIWDYTGWLGRAEASYQLRDALTVGLGYMVYMPNDDISMIQGYTTHDRIYASLRWDFLLE
jgi:hypothetical protein